MRFISPQGAINSRPLGYVKIISLHFSCCKSASTTPSQSCKSASVKLFQAKGISPCWYFGKFACEAGITHHSCGSLGSSFPNSEAELSTYCWYLSLSLSISLSLSPSTYNFFILKQQSHQSWSCFDGLRNFLTHLFPLPGQGAHGIWSLPSWKTRAGAVATPRFFWHLKKMRFPPVEEGKTTCNFFECQFNWFNFAGLRNNNWVPKRCETFKNIRPDWNVDSGW